MRRSSNRISKKGTAPLEAVPGKTPGVVYFLVAAPRTSVAVCCRRGVRTSSPSDLAFALSEFCATGASTIGQLSLGLAGLIVLAYAIWNFGYRQGTTGSSIGKSIMKFKVVSEKTGQPIGFGLSILRQLAHIIDGAICYIGYLFPLWDAKRQTIADKIMSTICLPI